jgi:hypothetical protein
VRWIALVPWIAGFAVFHWSAPSPLPGWQRAMEALFSDWLGAPFPLLGSALGASLPSFAVAFVLAVALLPLGVRRSPSRRVGERQR